MRIDKYICDTINITRTQAKSKISSGSVMVDGNIIRSSSFQLDENKSVVVIDGATVHYKKYVYIMMNKPAGILSATKDNKGQTAIDLLKKEDKRHDLFIAGRLDKDTTGFLLITNDGDFAHSILSPKKHIYKTYLVTLEHDNFDGYIEAFKSGVVLEDGYKTKKAEFTPLENSQCLLCISEGKFHQIKRMFLALGNKVIALSRIAMADVMLDENLNFGEYRYLTDEEIDLLMNKINKNNL